MMHLLANSANLLAFQSEVIPVVAIVFTFTWLIAKTLISPFAQARANKASAKSGAPGASSSGEDLVLIRQMQKTLTKMEERVEALETILIEQSRSQKI